MAKIGLQLYTLRDQTPQDFIGCLEKVKEAGYDFVEFAGYGNLSAAQLKEACERIGLLPYASHLGLDDFDQNLMQTADFLSELGARWAVLAWADLSTPEHIAHVAQVLKKAAPVLGKRGIQIAYHNHHVELSLQNGTTVLEELLKQSGVYSELDLFWVQHAGVDPVQFAKKLGKGISLYHFKDMDKQNEKKNIEIGSGLLDFEAVVAHIKASDIDWPCIIVEQENFDMDPFASIAQSCAYIQSIV